MLVASTYFPTCFQAYETEPEVEEGAAGRGRVLPGVHLLESSDQHLKNFKPWPFLLELKCDLFREEARNDLTR